MKKYLCTFVNNKVVQVSMMIGSASLLMTSPAHAALPTAAQTAFSQLVTAVSDVETEMWPVIGAVILAFTYIKLVKRGASKV